MYANVTKEFDIVQVSQPVCVVCNDSTAVFFVKFDEVGQLIFDAGNVVVDGFHCHHFTHISFAGGVTDHACAAAHQTDRTVAAALHVRHCHNGQEVTYMEAVCGRVDADIKCHAAFFKQFFDFIFVCQLFDKASFFQNFVSIHEKTPFLYWFVFQRRLSANKKGFYRRKDERTRGTTLIHVYHNEKTNIFRSG